MIEAYSLEDKISNIRKAIRNLTGESISNYEKEFQPTLLKKIDSDSSRNTQMSLEKFLEEKFEEDQLKENIKMPLENATEHTFDHTKDDENISRTSFKYPNSNKNIASFASDEIKDFPSIKFHDGKENYETSLLLEYERENVRKLESRVIKKDEIINNMNARQIMLSNEINDLKQSGCDTQIEEYKGLINNLQEKVEKYSNQIFFLQNQATRNISTLDFRSGYEDLQSKLINLERKNAELLGKQNELTALSLKSKQDIQIIKELKCTIEKKDKQIFEILQENKELQTRINELQELKKDSRQEYREFKLKEDINRLKKANEELSKGISAKVHQKSLESIRPRKRSCSSHQTMNEICAILRCSNSEIIQKLKKLKSSEKLEKRIETLVKDLSPQNTNLTPKHI